MNLEILFSLANATALAAWLLLAFAPRWKFTRKLVHSGAVPLLLSVAYLILLALFFGKAEGGFGTLAGVMKLFSSPNVVLAGWIHYLVFDLFVGAWEVNDAQTRGISHWLVVPCLFFTLMFGPVGFLLYHILRFFLAREVNHA